VMRDPNNISRGSGFVAFSTPEEASRAVSHMVYSCMAGLALEGLQFDAKQYDTKMNELFKGITVIRELDEMGYAKVVDLFGGIVKDRHFVKFLNDPVRKEKIENFFK
ncbi:hypothetical protein RYX36_032564, partial [Vicia faba]